MKMNVTKKIKKAVAAFFAFAVMTAGALDAQAVEVGPGLLNFALYGNTTEYMANLGPASSLLTPGTTTNIAISPSVLSAVSGTNPVKWALWGWNWDENTGDPTTMLASLTVDPAQLIGANPGITWNVAAVLAGQAADGQQSVLISSSNSNSFNFNFGTGGSLGGAFPVSTGGVFGSTLNIVEGDYSGGLWPLAMAGHASLNGDGSILTISGLTPPSVVPIPASVVLFASGLIGLVGIARRKMMTA